MANEESNSVSLINGTNGLISEIPVGNDLSAIAVNSNKNKIYVANQDSDTVSVITQPNVQSRPIDNGIVTPGIKVGVNPFKIFVNPDTNKIYVANSESLTISAIDAQTDKVYSTISLKNITDYFSHRLAYDSSQEKFYYVANGNIYTINSVTGDIKFLPVEKVNIEYLRY